MGVATAASSTISESPAGPAEAGTPVRQPPLRQRSVIRQTLGFVFSPLETHVDAQRRFGDVWSIRIPARNDFAVTCHPDHVKALVTAGERDAPRVGEHDDRARRREDPDVALLSDRHVHTGWLDEVDPPDGGPRCADRVQPAGRRVHDQHARVPQLGPARRPDLLPDRVERLGDARLVLAHDHDRQRRAARAGVRRVPAAPH